jgi:hypothetical protein
VSELIEFELEENPNFFEESSRDGTNKPPDELKELLLLPTKRTLSPFLNEQRGLGTVDSNEVPRVTSSNIDNEEGEKSPSDF